MDIASLIRVSNIARIPITYDDGEARFCQPEEILPEQEPDTEFLVRPLMLSGKVLAVTGFERAITASEFFNINSERSFVKQGHQMEWLVNLKSKKSIGNYLEGIEEELRQKDRLQFLCSSGSREFEWYLRSSGMIIPAPSDATLGLAINDFQLYRTTHMHAEQKFPILEINYIFVETVLPRPPIDHLVMGCAQDYNDTRFMLLPKADIAIIEPQERFVKFSQVGSYPVSELCSYLSSPKFENRTLTDAVSSALEKGPSNTSKLL